MISKHTQRLTTMVLLLTMVFSNLIFAQVGDSKGHWAEKSIQSWVEKGYVKGYPDGSFKPENNITRAEFISIVNRAFELTDKKLTTYKDIEESHWAYDEFQRASASGYIVGYEDGTFRPNSHITRQEVAAIIARLLTLEEDRTNKAFLNLEDIDEIPQWSAGVISAVVSQGYMKLRDGQLFEPTLPASRAEVIDALDRGYANFVKARYDLAGSYTAGDIDGSVEINGEDILLENTKISGHLIIGEGVGSGHVTLKNITVKGNTIIKGGGFNTIIIEDSDITNLKIEKKDGKVRILAKGNTYIKKTIINSGGKLESENKESNHFGSVEISQNIVSNQPIILKGNFESVQVKSGSNEIKIDGGRIEDFVILKTAHDLQLELSEDSKVDKMEIDARSNIKGKGRIGTAQISAKGVTLLVAVDKGQTAKGIEEAKSSPGGGGPGSIDQSDSDSTDIIESAEVDFDFDETTGTIKAYNGTEKNLVIPAKIRGVRVKAIGEFAFYGKDLKTVVVPKTVIHIEAGAFNNNQLSDKDAFIYARNTDGSEDKTRLVSYGGSKRDHIILPNSVKTIGEFAFSLQEISSISIGDSVTTIEDGAFSDNPLTSVKLPNSVISIGKYAFAECKISSVIIGDSVVTIDDYAFEYNQLTSVELPASLMTVGIGAFSWNSTSEESNIEEKPFEGIWVLEDNKWINQDRSYQVSLEGEAKEKTDYIITGADDLSKVARGTDLTITALKDILVNTEKMPKDQTKIIKIIADTTLVINLFKEIPVTQIKLDQAEFELDIGKKKVLSVNIIPEAATNKEVTWSSSDDSIATVAKGVVTAVAEGKATITASIGSITATSEVTVKEAPIIPVDQFIFDDSTGTINGYKGTKKI